MTAAPDTSTLAARLGALGYLLAAFVFLDPFLNTLLSLASPHPGTSLWRHGAAVLLAQTSTVYVVAALIAVVSAMAREDGRARSVLRRVCLSGAVLLGLVAVLSIVDATDLIGYLPIVQRSRFTLVSVKALWQLMLSAVVLVGLARVASKPQKVT